MRFKIDGYIFQKNIKKLTESNEIEQDCKNTKYSLKVLKFLAEQ